MLMYTLNITDVVLSMHTQILAIKCAHTCTCTYMYAHVHAHTCTLCTFSCTCTCTCMYIVHINHNTFTCALIITLVHFPSLLPVSTSVISSTLPVFSSLHSFTTPLLFLIRVLMPLSAVISVCWLSVMPLLVTSFVPLMLWTLRYSVVLCVCVFTYGCEFMHCWESREHIHGTLHVKG